MTLNEFIKFSLLQQLKHVRKWNKAYVYIYLQSQHDPWHQDRTAPPRQKFPLTSPVDRHGSLHTSHKSPVHSKRRAISRTSAQDTQAAPLRP